MNNNDDDNGRGSGDIADNTGRKEGIHYESRYSVSSSSSSSSSFFFEKFIY
jgi:hypothetical protein